MGLILMVSEDPVEIDTVSAALSVHGWWVTVAADREAALQAAADQAPKLVLVDHDLRDAGELLRTFGSVNGGPGVVVLVPEDFEGALELKEAGADDLVTKPGSPATVLEAVHRCLAAPRPGPPPRQAASNRLLTTEEIFGDVLREIGEAGAPPAARPAPALAGAEELFEPPAADDRIVSLSGLFDDPPAEPAAEPAAPTAPETPPPEAARSARGEWRGPERRSVDRPWSSADPPAEAPPAADRREPVAEPIDEDEEDTVVVSMPAASSEPAPPPAGPEEIDPADELEIEAPPPALEARAPRAVRRSALAIGSLAAALLAAAGLLFLLARGPESRAEPPPRAPAETTREAPAAASPAVEPAAVGRAGSGAPEALEPPEAASSPPEPAPAAGDGVGEFDIEAIVDEELERREEVLRRVFLEEEKRLLRELNNLEPGQATGDDGARDPRR